MSANKILAAKLIKNITKGGKPLAVEYATKTETWERLYLAESIQKDFTEAVEEATVPSNATKAILAEKEHPSISDSKNHFTTIYRDANDVHITTAHVYPKKK